MARRDRETEEEKLVGTEDADATAGSEGGDRGARRARYGLREPARVAADEFGGPIIGFVRDTLTGTLRATGAVASDAVDIVRDVLTGAVHATEEVGTEALGTVNTLGTGVVSVARDIIATGVGGVRHVAGSATAGRTPMRAEGESPATKETSTTT
ncbi:hypothetical protein [Cupriavidus necator]|uniref:hypothetical protein n=1 Tax=Cupriavidus necator TaxID=106590 RepID=UPI00278A045F|nr:hypothetical protein [Cupriavidus necator]MDQ0138530.1 hypothetical protein [Cupriavidus necator]